MPCNKKRPDPLPNQNVFKVDLAGVEPASESPSIRASPITVIILTFPPSDA